MTNYLRQFFDMLLYPLRALFDSPHQLLSVSRRVRALSIPMLAAILTAVLLTVAAVVFFWVAWQRDDDATVFGVPTKDARSVFVICLLIVVIPITVYYLLKAWLEGDVSQYPDIDLAWKAGMAELRNAGLDLTQVPLFLVFGVGKEDQAKSLFAASLPSLRVHDVPSGKHALHWFAGPEMIYLVASSVGQLTNVARLACEDRETPLNTLAGTPGPARVDWSRTMPLADALSGIAGNSPAADSPAPAPASTNIRGTMMLDADPRQKPSESSPAASGLRSNRRSVEREETRRLEYLCQLINQARQPLAPVNGVLAMLPLDAVMGPYAVQEAAREDIRTLATKLRLRCPVAVLVSGMEEEAGFRELVRRFGPVSAGSHRFGKGFDVWSKASAEEVEALTAHACGAFEDSIYHLFKERGGLGKPGNPKLYSLLCTIRRKVRGPLEKVLIGGFGVDEESPQDNLLFAGCYFAGTGNSEDRRAFVRSVIENRLPKELQEELAWLPAALVEERKYATWVQVVFWGDALLLVLWIGLILSHILPR